MAPQTSVIAALTVIGTLLFLVTITAIHQLCGRHRNRKTRAERNAEDAIRLTLSGPRSTEQLEYMKHVRERNLATAWKEARRFAQRRSKVKMVGYSTYVFDRYSTYIDEEADLGSVGSGAMVLSAPGEVRTGPQYLAPPVLPWMEHLSTVGSSIYSTDSGKSKQTIVEEWESEYGGFSAWLGMKQPVTQERWI